MAHHMNFDGQKKSKQNCQYIYIYIYHEKRNYKYAYHMKLQHNVFLTRRLQYMQNKKGEIPSLNFDVNQQFFTIF